MVLKKRPEYGFSGYQVPVTPQSTRSVRKRPVLKKNTGIHHYCAFDILATVAGNLLLEKDKSSPVESSRSFPSQYGSFLDRDDHKENSKVSSFSDDDDDDGNGDDDEENSSGCTQPVFMRKGFTPFRIPSESKKEVMHGKVRVGRAVTRNNYNGEATLSSKWNCPLKKRKSFYCSNSDGGVTSEADPSSPEIDDQDPPSLASKHHRVTSRRAPVKLRIKSFRIPELFIGIPETATVGFLKKTVMEAVTSVLGGGGLRVSVLLDGEKVGDDEDDKTLLQAGISPDNKADTVGFMLEAGVASTAETPLADSASSQLPPLASSARTRCVVESDGDSGRALVALHEPSMTVVPVVDPKPRRQSEAGQQRRVRRPFSVSEVEALVQAVEMLGTGRWRDVKLRGFSSAKHRTYVDLKDKWKTLVHTARISPQQRRGEPVPQELLDRVLAAQAYWSHHHHVRTVDSHHHHRAAVPETLLLLG